MAIHEVLIQRYGGLLGIRDENLLHSALEAPKVAFGGKEMYPSPYAKVAVYLFHLAKNHPFQDGNKRTAFAAVLLFLESNHKKMRFKNIDLEELVVKVAKGEMDKERLS